MELNLKSFVVLTLTVFAFLAVQVADAFHEESKPPLVKMCGTGDMFLNMVNPTRIMLPYFCHST